MFVTTIVQNYMKFWLSVFDLISSSRTLRICVLLLFIISEIGIVVLMNRVIEATTITTTTDDGFDISIVPKIPDERMGYTPNILLNYCTSIGTEGRTAYVNMMYFDLYPYMPGYALGFGLLTYYIAGRQKRNRTRSSGSKRGTNQNRSRNRQLYISWIFPTAMLFDIIESYLQLQTCNEYYKYYDTTTDSTDSSPPDSSITSSNEDDNYDNIVLLGCIGNAGKWLLLIIGFISWIPLLLC